QFRERLRPAEIGFDMRASAVADGDAIGDGADYVGGHCSGIIDGTQEAEAGRRAFAKSAGVNADDGKARGLGFDDGEREGFERAGGDVSVGGREAFSEALALAFVVEQANSWRLRGCGFHLFAQWAVT